MFGKVKRTLSLLLSLILLVQVLAPILAHATAVALPMPDATPVTRIVLFVIFKYFSTN